MARSQEKWLFSGYTEQNFSQIHVPGGMPGGRLEVLELTDIFTPLLNKPPTLCSFSGKEVTCIKLRTLLRFLSPLYFVIDCVN